MIRALLVDDEVLIRKGLILTVPWEKYGIQIIGEAGSAVQALQFIENNEIDLLLTDITMPNMSGMELMKTVMEKYPHIYVVVITCHQEFEYIQKVLRLGAIDYIVKTQIEDEELEDSLKRIAERINYERKGNETLSWMRGLKENSCGIILIPCNTTPGDVPDLLKTEAKVGLGNDSTLCLIGNEKAEKLKNFILNEGVLKDYITVQIKNIEDIKQDKLLGFINHYISYTLFYEYNYRQNFYEADAAELEINIKSVENEKFNQLKKEWSSILWILNTKEFDRLRINTTKMRPEASKLKNIFYKAMAEWETSMFIKLPARFEERFEGLRFWVDYEKWLIEIIDFMGANSNTSAYSEETVNMVINSIEYLKSNFSKDINQESVAKMFNLSRSYFSKVFKDIIGVNFVDYMKNIRIEKAKSILIQSNKPVYLIAEEIGFLDEKYFSRIFKETTGMLPVEFRNKNR